MAKIKKPARKGGAKKAAPKKPIPQQVVEKSVRARELKGRAIENDQTIGAGAKMPSLAGIALEPIQQASIPPPPRYPAPKPKPGILRRALEGAKRLFKFRSSVTGQYVDPETAAADPDHTVRERTR